MSDDKKIKPDDVLGQAEAAALFFRKLIAEGVPPQAAVMMASQYVQAQVVREMYGGGRSREAWEEE